MTTHIHTTKVLDGAASLGHSNILEGTVTVDGGAIPAGMVIDYVAGLVSWEDQENLGDPGPYVFEYEWEIPLDKLKAETRELIKAKAETKLQALDEVFTGAAIVTDFMTQEVVHYQDAGRPADPSAAIYSTAAVLQTVRGDATLRDTLEWMRTKYLDLKTAANDVIAQRFDYLEQINGAADAAAVLMIVAAVEGW